MAFEAIDINNESGGQAIKIPENFKIDDDKVYLKRVGNVLYIIPFHKPWQNLIDSLNDFTDDFMNDREQPSNQSRESFDL
jgi:antitoxin VapB